MASPQTIIGLYEHVAEAQQAVHLLLVSGFSSEAVQITTQVLPPKSAEGYPIDPYRPPATNNEVNMETHLSGHFLFSLFGLVEKAESHSATRTIKNASKQVAAFSPDSRAKVTISVYTTTEAERATDLLISAGAITA